MAAELGIDLQTLAQRVVRAAQLAASVHLFESLKENGQHYGRRVEIGGAGPVLPGDDAEVHSFGVRASCDAVVTDDEPAPLSTRAAGASRRPPQYNDGAD